MLDPLIFQRIPAQTPGEPTQRRPLRSNLVRPKINASRLSLALDPLIFRHYSLKRQELPTRFHPLRMRLVWPKDQRLQGHPG